MSLLIVGVIGKMSNLLIKKNIMEKQATGFYYDKPDEICVGDEVTASYDEGGYDGVTRIYEGKVIFDDDEGEFVLFCQKYDEVHPLNVFTYFQRLKK